MHTGSCFAARAPLRPMVSLLLRKAQSPTPQPKLKFTGAALPPTTTRPTKLIITYTLNLALTRSPQSLSQYGLNTTKHYLKQRGPPDSLKGCLNVLHIQTASNCTYCSVDFILILPGIQRKFVDLGGKFCRICALACQLVRRRMGTRYSAIPKP